MQHLFSKESHNMIKKNISIYELFSTVIERNTGKKSKKKFICHKCGKELKQFSKNHLKTCGITLEHYINRYDLPPKDYLLNQACSKLKTLYAPYCYKWVQLDDFWGYNTVYSKRIHRGDDSKKVCIPLNNSHFRNHLIGKTTLAIFPNQYSSTFLTFDIDCYDDNLKEGQKVAQEIKSFLTMYFPCTEVHISYSGHKGYHVTVFFDSSIEISKLMKLFSITLSKINLPSIKNTVIESRPEAKGYDGRALKLPLGINFENRKNVSQANDLDYLSSNYSCFVNDDLTPVIYDFTYLMNINPSKHTIVDTIIGTNEDVAIVTQFKPISLDESKKMINEHSRNASNNIENVLKYGLNEQGRRHEFSFAIALYYNTENYTKDNAYKMLLDWNYTQKQNGFSRSSQNQLIKDVRDIIEHVYSNNLVINKTPKDILLTPKSLTIPSDIFKNLEEINKIGSKSGKKVLNHQKVYLSMVIYSIYQNSFEKAYEMSYSEISYLSEYKNRSSIKKSVDFLERHSFISIVRRNEYKDYNSSFKKKNMYQISRTDGVQNAPYTLAFNIQNDTFKFENIIIDYYGIDNLKNVVSRWVSKKLIKEYKANI